MAGTKLVRDMSYRAHDKLFMALRPDTPGRDWKALADLMGYTYEQIKNFECERHPVKALINHWEVENKTISELMDFLAQIERNDLLEDLKPFIGKAPCYSFNSTGEVWDFSGERPSCLCIAHQL